MSAMLVVVGLGMAQGVRQLRRPIHPFGSGNGDGSTGGNGDGQGLRVRRRRRRRRKVCTSGLCTQAIDCSGQGTGDTTISGTVTDPAGKNPLYNVLVYIPNFPDKVPGYTTTDRAATFAGLAIPGGVLQPRSSPASTAKFVLPHVPVAANVPVIVQVGKWRRTYTFANINKCVENAAPSLTTFIVCRKIRAKDTSRRSRSPQVAQTRWNACSAAWGSTTTNSSRAPDASVSIKERATAPEMSRPHYDAAHGGTAFPDSRTFWNTPAQVNAQDIIIYSCEGQAFDGTPGNGPDDKTANGIPNTIDFLNHGGKMFASHWHRGLLLARADAEDDRNVG